MGDELPAAVGQAVIGTVLIIIGAFAPLVLFRLLAFVDPGTSSGQAFRASLDAAGGLGGLLGGSGQDGQGEQSSGSGSATATSGDGSSSQGEAAAAARDPGAARLRDGPGGLHPRRPVHGRSERRGVRRGRPRRRRRRSPAALLRYSTQLPEAGQPVQAAGQSGEREAGPGQRAAG